MASETADSFAYATTKEGVSRLEAEVHAARRAGLDMDLVAEADLSFPIEAALRLREQALFHPSISSRNWRPRFRETAASCSSGAR